MSYLSASENVGFSSIPQNISDASCASLYKMAVESVPGSCNNEVNMYIHDSSGDEQSYIPHLTDNFFHTKFKIDHNDLYTFHDSDIIAGEITVSHTDDNFIFSDEVDAKVKLLDSPNKELDILGVLTNGDIKEEIKEPVLNGQYSPNIILSNPASKLVDSKAINSKVKKQPSQVNCMSQPNSTAIRRPSVHSPKNQSTSQSGKVGITNSNASNEKTFNSAAKGGSETFLDVFKREQCLTECQKGAVKTDSNVALVKPTLAPKKPSSVKPSQAKVKKGRGPIMHEALQRIPTQCKALVVPVKTWHAPDEELFQCGPLDTQKCNPFKQLESSSSDDDNMPDFESVSGPICVEESAAESRSARLELRRAAMRRHVVRTATSMQLIKKHDEHKALATLIKMQLNGKSSCRLPQQTMNHLLATRGMTSTLSLQERRKLRGAGWSGGESGKLDLNSTNICAEEKCTQAPLPCGRHCLAHVTLAPEQRLYAACAAVFAGGERCKQPLLQLQEQIPLCAEHAWKRDNYEQLNRESKPPRSARKRTWSGRVRPPSRARPPSRVAPRSRRRRAAPRRVPAHTQSLSELNACSNSSYDSSEDTVVGLSESEYMTNNSGELEVGHVPPDDILDPSVLSQIPDEAFTEFFNQAEGGSAFAESSELAAALEAVLDERALDMPDCVFAPPAAPGPAPCAPPSPHTHKMQMTAVSMGSSSSS